MSPALIFTIGLIILILFVWYFATDDENRKRWIGSILTVLVTAVAIASIIPPFDIPKRDAAGNVVKDEKGKPIIEKHGRLKRGIDIAGGTSFLIRLQPAKNEDGTTRD